MYLSVLYFSVYILSKDVLRTSLERPLDIFNPLKVCALYIHTHTHTQNYI